MSGRKALISKDDLGRMAEVAAKHSVAVKGRIDPMGNFTFDIAPIVLADARNDDEDDFTARIDGFCGK